MRLSKTKSGEPRISHPMSIAAVERDCGIPKDTLRVWERRYGFPRPLRDPNGERLYPEAQVTTLRLLRRLIDAGHRPGKVVGRSDGELAILLEQLGEHAPQPVRPEARELLKLLAAYDAAGLRETLDALVRRIGLGAFVLELAPDLAAAVGAAWARGELEIHQEHLFTEQFINVLRSTIQSVQVAGPPPTRPRVLFSTIPREPHALGLLMAEAMFALQGCVGVSLGVQTPVPQIAAAAEAHRADILALSFSPIVPAAQAVASLRELRGLVPTSTEIWAGGGGCPRRPIAGVILVRSLPAIGDAVEAWRTRMPDATS